MISMFGKASRKLKPGHKVRKIIAKACYTFVKGTYESHPTKYRRALVATPDKLCRAAIPHLVSARIVNDHATTSDNAERLKRIFASAVLSPYSASCKLRIDNSNNGHLYRNNKNASRKRNNGNDNCGNMNQRDNQSDKDNEKRDFGIEHSQTRRDTVLIAIAAAVNPATPKPPARLALYGRVMLRMNLSGSQPFSRATASESLVKRTKIPWKEYKKWRGSRWFQGHYESAYPPCRNISS
ncbi:LOW QUALITY PROTEIN: hypothetical protein PHMEG_00015295 [Phytophthora megakarya]|uniref:Uncharacterized protein n=1 Tax=Phytophthora megakarya TaxID=4795 RepID=A0A225W1V2_9STRA|nr:LOW QUALITY PROTEIN: hypothetical protein PHMEG_00015295 [Phytophthora megakarya]